MAAELKPTRLRVLFQPHRYSRTKALLNEFPPAFAEADEVVLIPVYPAFEEPIPGGDIADLYKAFKESNVFKDPNLLKAPKDLKDPKDKKDQKEKKEVIEVKETVTPSTTPAYLVPLWYTDFPAHRVNPMGRTNIATLPDEINLLLIRDSTEFCFPVKSRKTSNYGWRWNRGHHGVDIGLRTGEPIHAAFSGTVRVAGRMGGYGNCIVVRHANGLETLYGHLSKINVKPLQEVAAGEIIGLGGNTGNSTGPHLHFEIRVNGSAVNPLNYLQ